MTGTGDVGTNSQEIMKPVIDIIIKPILPQALCGNLFTTDLFDPDVASILILPPAPLPSGVDVISK